jgi:hypothetical protein
MHDPEKSASVRVDRVDLVSNILGADLSERASKARVVRYERAIQIKNIHGGYYSSRCEPTRDPRPDIATSAVRPRQDGASYRRHQRPLLLERIAKGGKPVCGIRQVWRDRRSASLALCRSPI